jgi:hypothetical protein
MASTLARTESDSPLTFDLYDERDQAWERALFSQPGDAFSNTFYS